MSSPTFSRVQALFDQAMDKPTAERAKFLQEIDTQNPAIAGQVRELLQVHGQLADDQTLQPDLASVMEADLRGREVGPFTLTELVGQGGMGRVYRAERHDGELEQEVAVKVLRGLWLDEQARSRFHVECQVLAHLQHPDIARLIDTGALAEGTPYLMMEYVRGEPIVAYCEGRKLRIRQRLELFNQVAEAVAYAHRKLIVHRDLKPSNILVNEEGQVKLLDFGIAKPLMAKLGQVDVEHTQTASRMFSPAYAAPEQIAGEPASVSYDVYALGVVLYQLLTGQLPFSFEGKSPSEVEHDIRHKQPKLPSRCVSDRAQVRALRGGLDSIILKCLAKSPERRYQTVAELIEDIERYYMQVPVRAHQGRIRYRLGKYVRRNRMPITATAVVITALSVATLLTYRQYRETENERDRARFVTEFMISAFEAADPSKALGAEVTASQILEQSLRSLEVQEQENPRAVIELLMAIARVQMTRGLYSDAEKTITRVNVRLDDLEDEVLYRRLLIIKANLAETDNRIDELKAITDEALQLNLTPQQRINFRYYQIQAMRETQLEESMPPLEELLGDMRAAGLEDTVLGQNIERLHGVTVAEVGDFGRSVKLLEGLYQKQKESLPENHPGVIATMHSLALAYTRTVQLDKGQELGLRLIEVTRQLYGEDSISLASAYTNYANNLEDPRQAMEWHIKSLNITRQHFGGQHPGLARIHFNIAMTGVTDPELYDLSDEHYRASLTVGEAAWAPEHRNLHLFRVAYALFLNQTSDFDKAAEVARLSIAIVEQKPEYKKYEPYPLGELALAIAEYGLEPSSDKEAAVHQWLEQTANVTVQEMRQRQVDVLTSLAFPFKDDLTPSPDNEISDQ